MEEEAQGGEIFDHFRAEIEVDRAEHKDESEPVSFQMPHIDALHIIIRDMNFDGELLHQVIEPGSWHSAIAVVVGELHFLMVEHLQH